MDYISLIVLAKSYKKDERCIAGKQVTFNNENNHAEVGDWVRPVTNTAKVKGIGAIPKNIYCPNNADEIKLLDVVKIPILKRINVPGQPENYLIDENKPWLIEGDISPATVKRMVDSVQDIWLEEQQLSHVVSRSFDEKGFIEQSLILIKPTNLRVVLSVDFDTYEKKFKKKAKASFSYKGIQYEGLSITDPALLRALCNQYPGNGDEPITTKLHRNDDYTLCISLTPRFGKQQLHYKLIASVFDDDGYLQQRYAA